MSSIKEQSMQFLSEYAGFVTFLRPHQGTVGYKERGSVALRLFSDFPAVSLIPRPTSLCF